MHCIGHWFRVNTSLRLEITCCGSPLGSPNLAKSVHICSIVSLKRNIFTSNSLFACRIAKLKLKSTTRRAQPSPYKGLLFRKRSFCEGIPWEKIFTKTKSNRTSPEEAWQFVRCCHSKVLSSKNLKDNTQTWLNPAKMATCEKLMSLHLCVST